MMIRNACSPAELPVDSRSKAAAGLSFGKHGRRGSRYVGNDEPCLEELLADDVLRRLMVRDGVAADQVRQLAAFIRN